VCTAYKIGKRGNLPGKPLYEQELEYYMGVAIPRIVRPTHKAPVILPDGSLREMTWGFKRQMKGRTGKPISRTIVNSREDKLGGRTWSEAFRERRCLIPAFSFFEWVERGGRMVPLEFEDAGDRLLWIAGIWEQDPNRGDVFSMVTTDPNTLVAPVHDRMPAVLSFGQIRPYLGGDLHEFGPSSVALRFGEAENFLSPKKNIPPIQDELF
jgi:putative SOS response-associated peptidase YedK